jgi:aquaporin Z
LPEKGVERIVSERTNDLSAADRRKRGVRKALVAEFIGTSLLVLVGLSIVIVAFGTGSPVTSILADAGLRRVLTGFLFGTTGALIAVSWVGKASGAHINPAVTLGFWIMGKMRTARAAGYMLAQCAGAVVGALPLLLWGGIGRSVDFGATTPGPDYGTWLALAGETVTTFALVVGLFLFIGHKRLAPWTPLLFPFLYAVMVFLEAPISGTSTNPARTLGPAVISEVWRGWWIYLLGPVIGAWLGTIFQKFRFLRQFEIEVAKIYHFGHDPHGIFHNP